jgi:hypothetical protein
VYEYTRLAGLRQANCVAAGAGGTHGKGTRKEA